MAPSDAMEDLMERFGALRVSTRAKDRHSFHLYVHLPFELREQIRAEAIDARKQSIEHWVRRNLGRVVREPNLTPLHALATVSKEWQHDVEKVLWREIRINPHRTDDLGFMRDNLLRYLTYERHKALKRLDIELDDTETGPWSQEMGLLEIAQTMETVGRLLQGIHKSSYHIDEKQRSIQLVFSSQSQRVEGRRPQAESRAKINIPSLWDHQSGGLLRYGSRAPPGGPYVPCNIVRWAIKYSIRSSLDMITLLNFPVDCLPEWDAQDLIQSMPNLETCIFDIRFLRTFGMGWKYLADIIRQLHTLAPSLRNLTLQSSQAQALWREELPHYECRAEFCAVLRDYSQCLETLRVEPIMMHEEFFMPFSEEDGAIIATSELAWPRLRVLDLEEFFQIPAPHRKLEPVDQIIAAARAARAMPALEYIQIKPTRVHLFLLTRFRSSCEIVQRGEAVTLRSLEVRPMKPLAGTYNMYLEGFGEDEQQRIVTAWSSVLGTQGHSWDWDGDSPEKYLGGPYGFEVE